MKNVIALVFGTSLTSITIYLKIASDQPINTTEIIVFLTFTIIGGLAISNNDILKKIRLGSLELQTFKRQADKIKQNVISELSTEVERQKESLREIVETQIKIASILADGSGRWDGFPEGHLDQINLYKKQLNKLISPTLDAEIEITIKELNDKIKKKGVNKK